MVFLVFKTRNETFGCKFYSRCYFGKYPNEKEIDVLKNHGITHIIDLTTEEDGLPEYDFYGTRINFPIPDRKVPRCNEEMKDIIDSIYGIWENKTNRIYIHCKGGHGRSGLVAGCLLKKILDIDGDQCLEMIHVAHQTRIEMKPRMRKLGAPQTLVQKKFVRNFEP
jgi:hypothetical protein